MSIIYVNTDEIELKEGESVMSVDEMETLMEHKEIFKKFLRVSQYGYRYSLANMKLAGKEANAYVSIDTITELIQSLDKTPESYKAYKQALLEEAKKAQKEKESLEKA